MKTQIRTLDVAYNVFCRFEQCAEVKHYPGLVALYALAQLAVVSQNPMIVSKAQKLLGRYPDQIDHPRYNFESYRVGGNGRAYLVMNGLDDAARDLLREYAEITLHAPVDANGIQCMPAPERLPLQQVWIDVVTATTPFMVMAGIALDEPKYVDYGIEQCFKMYDLFEDPQNHLLHQARGFMADVNAISEDHWSRGNGWGIIGLADILQYLPRTAARWEEAACRLRRHCEALRQYQTAHGLWRQSIACELAWEESSGTGLIAYSMGVALRMGVLDGATYFPVFQKAVQGLADWCLNADFSTERSCRGCLCPGVGAEKGTLKAYLCDVYAYRNEPHSFGPIMLAMIEAHKNGIREIAWKEKMFA